MMQQNPHHATFMAPIEKKVGKKEESAFGLVGFLFLRSLSPSITAYTVPFVPVMYVQGESLNLVQCHATI